MIFVIFKEISPLVFNDHRIQKQITLGIKILTLALILLFVSIILIADLQIFFWFLLYLVICHIWFWLLLISVRVFLNRKLYRITIFIFICLNMQISVFLFNITKPTYYQILGDRHVQINISTMFYLSTIF